MPDIPSVPRGDSYADILSGDALATVITVTDWIIYAMSMYKLSRSLGHGVLYALGLIFLQPLFTIILGFGGSKWQGGASE